MRAKNLYDVCYCIIRGSRGNSFNLGELRNEYKAAQEADAVQAVVFGELLGSQGKIDVGKLLKKMVNEPDSMVRDVYIGERFRDRDKKKDMTKTKTRQTEKRRYRNRDRYRVTDRDWTETVHTQIGQRQRQRQRGGPRGKSQLSSSDH